MIDDCGFVLEQYCEYRDGAGVKGCEEDGIFFDRHLWECGEKVGGRFCRLSGNSCEQHLLEQRFLRGWPRGRDASVEL